jgi:hypothetical protein
VPQGRKGGRGRGEVDPEKGGERQHRERSHRRRYAAVAVHADEQPPDPGGEPAGAVQAAEPGGAARGGHREARNEPGERRDRQPPGLRVHEGQGLQRTRGRGQRGVDPAPAVAQGLHGLSQ